MWCSYEDLKFEFSCLSCRHLLHHCFQALMDHGVKVASVLANSFSRRCSYIAESDAHVKEKAIQFGFVLGNSKYTYKCKYTMVVQCEKKKEK